MHEEVKSLYTDYNRIFVNIQCNNQLSLKLHIPWSNDLPDIEGHGKYSSLRSVRYKEFRFGLTTYVKRTMITSIDMK